MKGRSNRGRYGWLASLLVTVLAVAPLLAIFHQASVRHAVCEHGDLIEAGEAPAPATGEGAAHDAFQADSAPAEHGHSHCSVGTLAKSGTGVIAPAAATVALLEHVVAAPVRAEVICARPVLTSAPKTSPPTVRTSVLS